MFKYNHNMITSIVILALIALFTAIVFALFGFLNEFIDFIIEAFFDGNTPIFLLVIAAIVGICYFVWWQ